MVLYNVIFLTVALTAKKFHLYPMALAKIFFFKHAVTEMQQHSSNDKNILCIFSLGYGHVTLLT